MSEHRGATYPVRRTVTVDSVRAFAAPTSQGEWPCVVCGERFSVRDSWQIHLENTGPVVACGRCADHARRNGSIAVPADTTMTLDHTRFPDPGSDDGGSG